MSKKEVSVVVPNYNHAPYLVQRLDSILQQSFQDFEIVILDDNSQDHSQQIIQQYAARDSRVSVAFNTQNSGSPFHQWNKGVEIANGEFIWIAESDDFAHPQFLNTLLKPLRENAKLGVAYCQSQVINEYNKIIKPSMEWWTNDLDKERWKTAYTNNGKDECREYLSLKCTIPNASAVVFRKSVFVEAGGANALLRKAGDWLIWVKMLLKSDIYYSPLMYNYFREHTDSTRNTPHIHQIMSKIEEDYQVVKFIIEQVPMSVQQQEKALQANFIRCARIIPLKYILSQEFIRFARIVQKVDNKFIKRLIMYAPDIKDRVINRF